MEFPIGQVPRKLLELNTLFGINVKCFLPLGRNTVQGVISHPELAYVTEEEAADLLDVQAVKKLGQKDTVIIYCGSTNLPETIDVGWDTVPVRPLKPRPTRCYKCQKYGHQAKKCWAHEVCSFCGEPGHQDDTCSATTEKCAACGGPHSSSDPECPKWREECKIIKLRTKKKLTYKEALLEVKNVTQESKEEENRQETFEEEYQETEVNEEIRQETSDEKYQETEENDDEQETEYQTSEEILKSFLEVTARYEKEQQDIEQETEHQSPELTYQEVTRRSNRNKKKKKPKYN